MSVKGRLTLGTRGSALALVQSRWVAGEITQLGWEVSLEIIRTTGDNITDIPLGSIDVKGLFVKEIEQALLERRIDLAVHSMKDLPPQVPAGLTVGAIPKREDPRDVLVGRTAKTLRELPTGAIVGTSSPRRAAQVLAARPDVTTADLRGNLDTRLRKLDEGQYDAICLAAAGLRRLGLADRITEYIDPDVMMPAVGQGALAIEVRADDEAACSAIGALHHQETGIAVTAERAVLDALNWGCSVPLGVLATISNGEIHLKAALCSLDGKMIVREQMTGVDPDRIGREMADRLRAAEGKIGYKL